MGMHATLKDLGSGFVFWDFGVIKVGPFFKRSLSKKDNWDWFLHAFIFACFRKLRHQVRAVHQWQGRQRPSPSKQYLETSVSVLGTPPFLWTLWKESFC